MQPTDLGVVFQCLQTVLYEARPQILPVIFGVEIVLGAHELVGLVHSSDLPYPQVRDNPGDIGIVFDDFVEVVIGHAVMDDHKFSYRVTVELKESIKGGGQHLGTARSGKSNINVHSWQIVSEFWPYHRLILASVLQSHSTLYYCGFGGKVFVKFSQICVICQPSIQ